MLSLRSVDSSFFESSSVVSEVRVDCVTPFMCVALLGIAPDEARHPSDDAARRSEISAQPFSRFFVFEAESVASPPPRQLVSRVGPPPCPFTTRARLATSSSRRNGLYSPSCVTCGRVEWNLDWDARPEKSRPERERSSLPETRPDPPNAPKSALSCFGSYPKPPPVGVWYAELWSSGRSSGTFRFQTKRSSTSVAREGIVLRSRDDDRDRDRVARPNCSSSKTRGLRLRLRLRPRLELRLQLRPRRRALHSGDADRASWVIGPSSMDPARGTRTAPRRMTRIHSGNAYFIRKNRKSLSPRNITSPCTRRVHGHARTFLQLVRHVEPAC